MKGSAVRIRASALTEGLHTAAFCVDVGGRLRPVAIAGALALALLNSGDALALVGVIVVVGLLIAAIFAIFVVDSGWRSVRIAREIFRKQPPQ
jgi:purine-cytosine permease-like protein